MDEVQVLQISTEEVRRLIEDASDYLEEERAQSWQAVLDGYSIEVQGDPACAIAQNFGPGTYGMHEAFDRSAMLSHMVEEWLQEHPAVVMDKVAYWKARLAVALISQVYSRLGELDDSDPAA